jgi:hypothetical protein
MNFPFHKNYFAINPFRAKKLNMHKMNMAKIIIISFFLSLMTTQCKKDKLIIMDPNYAIGIIVFYSPAYRNSSHIDFYFYSITGRMYEINYPDGHNGWSIPGGGNYKSGDKYMVQYSKTNPNIARMLFSYPVPDSATYRSDTAQFRINPPQ